jgi:hypothetical protein
MVLLAAGIQLIMLFSEICVLPVHHSLPVVLYGEKWVEFRLFMPNLLPNWRNTNVVPGC